MAGVAAHVAGDHAAARAGFDAQVVTGSAADSDPKNPPAGDWDLQNSQPALLEALIALPEQLFYNTGIATYIWVLTNRKARARKGKVLLVVALFAKEALELGSQIVG